MNYSLIHTLFSDLEQFEQEMGERPIRDFALWIYEKYWDEPFQLPPNEDQPFLATYDGELAAGISTLYLHARHYVRKALEGSLLNGLTDFGFLANLLEHDNLTKSELIDLQVLEFSSGMEVIRRLIRRGLAEDYPSPKDKRSRLVKITDKGKQELEKVWANMGKVGQIIGGNLTEEEKPKAVAGIRKLMHFHHKIWKEDQDKSLDQIISKYPELDR